MQNIMSPLNKKKIPV